VFAHVTRRLLQEQSSVEKLQTLKQQRAKIIGPAFVPNAAHKSMLTQSIITHPMNISSLCAPQEAAI
jgi:hypothetical protein